MVKNKEIKNKACAASPPPRSALQAKPVQVKQNSSKRLLRKGRVSSLNH